MQSFPPRLKQANVNHESFNTFRPISNPTFISRRVEKVVATQLGHRVEDSNLNGIYQSD